MAPKARKSSLLVSFSKKYGAPTDRGVLLITPNISWNSCIWLASCQQQVYCNNANHTHKNCISQKIRILRWCYPSSFRKRPFPTNSPSTSKCRRSKCDCSQFRTEFLCEWFVSLRCLPLLHLEPGRVSGFSCECHFKKRWTLLVTGMHGHGGSAAWVRVTNFPLSLIASAQVSQSWMKFVVPGMEWSSQWFKQDNR